MTEEVIIKVGTSGEESVTQLNKKLGDTVNNANKASKEVLKMKSAFDVVSSALNTASIAGDKFINKLLSVRFPQVGQMAEKEVKILYQAFVQAERIGSEMFDMASLAAKVFKGDMHQVNLAIAQYNELFEKNTGVDGITLNTSALLALRNQVISTGSSVSILNKEISNMANGAESVKTFEGVMVNINNYIKDGILNLDAFSDALIKAKNNGIQLNESLISSAAEYESELDDIVDNLDYLRKYRANPDEFFSTTGSGSEELERQIKLSEQELHKTYARKEAIEAYNTSIQGLRDEVSRLTTEYSKLSAVERDGLPGKQIVENLQTVRKEIESAEIPLNKLGISALRGKNSGFDPLANSIMQLGRELPNFAISANIGFMAISNNLPILADAISDFRRMREEVIEFNKTAVVKQEVPNGWKALKGAIFSLGGALTLISGLFLVFGDKIIKGVIDWINKIPKDVKIKIDIETEALEQTKKVQTDIIKLGKDYELALKKNDTERLKLLDNISKKEYGLNDQQLKLIKSRTDGWREAFKEYLKMAEDTYYNEAIIKKGVEAQITGKQALSRARNLFENQVKKNQGNISKKAKQILWTGYVKAAQDGSFTQQMAETLFVYGIDQQIIDELRAVSEQNAIIRSLPKLRDVDLKTGVEKPSGGSSGSSKSKSSLNMSLDRDVKAELTNIDNFYKPIIDSEIRYTNEELVIMEDNKKKRSVVYDEAIEDKVDYIKRIEEARRKDMSNELNDLYGKKTIIQAEVDRFDELKSLYEQDVNELNTYETNKADIQNKIISLDKELSSLGDKATQEDVDRILAKKKTHLDEIELIDADINAKNSQIEALKVQLKEAEGYPEKMAQITAQIAQLNVAITDSLRASTDSERAIWDARISMAKDYLDAISNVAGGLADIAQGNMDLINAEYDRKIWANDEMIQSDEQRADKEYEIEMARWAALQENFEMQKKMKEAQAWMDFASGSVGIWTAPGITSLAPFGYILAATQQAALLATTIGNVKSIRSQQMLKPHKNNSGSSSGSSSALTPALNPVKNALTSRDENLNTMTKSNQKDSVISVVKVSEINDVQNKVEVREKNSSY